MQRQKTTAGHLMLFTRFPQAGETKTRLIPALGAEGATSLQRRMSEAAFATLRACRGVSLEVRCCGADADAVRRWLPGADSYAAQGEGDLGARLGLAFAAAFARGARPVAAVGADCPALTADHLAAALAALADHDLVLGPARDGGYYLIGLQAPHPGLFRGIPWGTAAVLRQTLARAKALGLRHHLLETLPDVDRPEDLTHLDHHPGAQ
jgi:hypothetical protein